MSINQYSAKTGRMIREDNTVVNVADLLANGLQVKQVGLVLAEQKSHADLSNGAVTFSEPLSGEVQVHNADAVNALTVNINGFIFTVPKDSTIGPTSVDGTPSATVAISGDSTTWYITRYR